MRIKAGEGRAAVSRAPATMRPAVSLAHLGLLLSIVVGSQQLSITELSVPRAQQAGQDVKLQCHIDHEEVPEDAVMVKWWRTGAQGGSPDRTQLYQRIAPNKPQSLHNIQVGEDDSIVLVNATPADSGVYECEVSAMTPDVVEERQHAVLTLYTPGSGPQLNVTEVAGRPDVLFTCRVDDVAPEPDILITIDGEEVNVTEEVTGPDAAGLYWALGRVSRPKEAVEGSHVECELLYLDTNVTLHERYRAQLDYYHSGAPPTEEPPAVVTEPSATDASQNSSGGSCACHVSWALLLVVALSHSYLPYFKSSM